MSICSTGTPCKNTSVCTSPHIIIAKEAPTFTCPFAIPIIHRMVLITRLQIHHRQARFHFKAFTNCFPRFNSSAAMPALQCMHIQPTFVREISSCLRPSGVICDKHIIIVSLFNSPCHSTPNWAVVLLPTFSFVNGRTVASQYPNYIPAVFIPFGNLFSEFICSIGVIAENHWSVSPQMSYLIAPSGKHSYIQTPICCLFYNKVHMIPVIILTINARILAWCNGPFQRFQVLKRQAFIHVGHT